MDLDLIAHCLAVKAIKGQEFYKEPQKEIKDRNEYTLLDIILLLKVEMHK
jgi:hypothetical protein